MNNEHADISSCLQMDHFDGLCCARLRNVIWKLFEDPNSSSAARVLVIVSSLFLLSSIIMLILSTIPTFQVQIQCVKIRSQTLM